MQARSGSSSSGSESIHRATRRQRDAVLGLWLDLIEHHRRLDPNYPVPRGLRESLGRELDRALRGEHCRVFVAEVEGRVEGFLLAEIEPAGSPESARVAACWIHEIFVAPEMRDRGLGGRLVEAARSFFRERGASRASVRVESRNESADRFWRRVGFGDRAHILESDL